MLIQKSKPKAVKPQQYHGHTIIELKNVHTGIRDRVESDNEFTLGIQTYIKGCGKYGSPWSNATWKSQNIWRNLLGGIMLFDKEIPQSGGQYPLYMPAGTKMTANGAYGVTNNGNPTELMSYNENESSFSESALVFVYDATTSQANGHHEAVSLCTETGGYVGMGNSVSNVAHATKRLLNTNMSYGQLSSAYTIIAEDYIGTVTSTITNGEVTYTLEPYPTDNVTLFDFDQTFTAELPSDFNNLTVSAIAGKGLKIMVIENFTTSAMTFKAGLYDIATGAWTVRTFELPTNTHRAYSQINISTFDDGFYIHATSGNSLVEISSFFDFTTGDTTGAETLTNAEQEYYIARIAPQLYMTKYGQIYDEVNDSLFYTNVNRDYILDGQYMGGRLRVNYSGWYSSIKALFPNPLMLMTVNNLDSPVDKGTSDTMKVIYTVTPV